MTEVFGYLSGILVVLGTLPYIRDIFLRKTKPQRSTWFIYSVLGGIAFFSQLAKGATFSLWLTGLDTLSVVVVFICSLWYGVGGFEKKDYRVLAVAAIALLLWFFTKEAAVALYLIIGIDAIGTYLTVDKAYKDPSSESYSAWVCSAIAGIFAMISVGSLNIILLSYPLYIFLANGAVVAAMWLGKKQFFPKKKDRHISVD